MIYIGITIGFIIGLGTGLVFGIHHTLRAVKKLSYGIRDVFDADEFREDLDKLKKL